MFVLHSDIWCWKKFVGWYQISVPIFKHWLILNQINYWSTNSLIEILRSCTGKRLFISTKSLHVFCTFRRVFQNISIYILYLIDEITFWCQLSYKWWGILLWACAVVVKFGTIEWMLVQVQRFISFSWLQFQFLFIWHLSLRANVYIGCGHTLQFSKLVEITSPMTILFRFIDLWVFQNLETKSYVYDEVW